MKKLTFIQIGDLHYSAMGNAVEELKDAINKDLNDNIKNEYNIDFILFSGDLVNGSKLSTTKENDTKLFEDAFNNFIFPIIEKFSLTKDKIFIAPGNHDLNRNLIAKSAYNTYSFQTEDDIQNIVSDIEKGLISFSHFEQFNSFISSLDNSNEVSSSKLYRVYKIKIHSFELGIICLNNCLNSFNSKNIHGNVIMAEKELHKALKELNDCHIKILNMHYPLSWTNKFEFQKLITLVAKNFNMVFVGHEHFKVFTKANINSYDTFTYNAPSLFQGDNKTCGYTIFEYDFDNKKLKIHFREYDFEHKHFKSSNELDICYVNDFNIFNNLGKEKHNILVIDSLIENFYSQINDSSLFTKSNYNLNFENMFILPHLSIESSYKDSDNVTSKNILMDEILKDNKNYIFYGSELVGKTSLLYYIAIYYMKYKTEHLKIPIYIDLSELVKINKSSLISEIKSFLDLYTKSNNSNKFIQEQLDNKSFILLLDNLPTNEDQKKIILDLLNNEFSQLKIFISSVEDSYKNITFSNTISDNISKEENDMFNILFIHSYKREQARLFFKNWFSEKFDEYMFEKFYDYINKFNIPATPFIFSLLCISYEKGTYEEYPNEIILLETFIDNLLGKGDIKKDKKELSYKLKKKYLSNLATKIIKSGAETIDKFEVESFTSEFLKAARMYDLNTLEVIKYFVKKDIIILSKDNTLYKFKFKAFLEYFIALEMKNNNDFKEEVLFSYLSYTEEIKIYAGITESQDSYKQLIDKFFHIINNNFSIYESVKENTGGFLYSDTDIVELNIDKKSDIFNKLEYKEKDKLLEVDNKSIIKSNIKSIIDEKKITEEEIYYKTNLLSMSIIKYAETFDQSDLINSFTKLVLESHSRLFFSILNRLEEVDKEQVLQLFIEYCNENNIEDKEKLTINKILDIFKSFYNVLTTIFSNILNQNLFDEHVINIINDNIINYNTITKLFILMHYISENNTKMFKYFDLLINDFKEDKNKYRGYFFTILYFSILRIKLDLINQNFKDNLINKLLQMIEALYPSDYRLKNIIETQRRNKLLLSINR